MDNPCFFILHFVFCNLQLADGRFAMKANVLGVSLALLLCLPALSVAQTTGRTDGPEKSELGKGGYPFGGQTGHVFLTPSFGSGFFEVPGRGEQTGLLYGLDLGYEMDEWIGLQGSYAYLTDRRMSIFGVGSRFTCRRLPFAYDLFVQPGLYAPRGGARNFGLASGVGISVIPHERVQVGIHYAHDAIFSDTRSHLDRVYATVGVSF